MSANGCQKTKARGWCGSSVTSLEAVGPRAWFTTPSNRQAHLWAFVDTFRLFGLLALGCVPLIFLFKHVQHGKKPEAAAVH